MLGLLVVLILKVLICLVVGSVRQGQAWVKRDEDQVDKARRNPRREAEIER